MTTKNFTNSSNTLKKLTLGILSILLFFPNFSKAQESTSDSTEIDMSDMFEMSLEDLMGITVTSASKKAEGIFDAPSVVATITAQEITDFGARNLYEVLEKSASFYGIYSYFFPQNAIALRGDLPTHTNPNILFLIDGRPVRESIKGGQSVAILTTYPLSAIQQVEFIRGPGSVLYGSNAYIGVVNIITKKGKSDKPTVYFESNGGSMSTLKTEATVLGGIKDLTYNVSLNYYKTDGWELSDSLFFAGKARYANTMMGQDVLATNLGLQYKGFSFSGFYGQNKMGKTHHTGAPAIYDAHRLFTDIGYADTLTDWYNFSTNITYNRINDSFWENAPDGLAYRITANDMVYELTNFFKVNDKIEVTLGGSVSTMSGEQYYGDGHIVGGEEIPYPVEPYNFIWVNGYVQGDYKPTNWLKFVLGGQVNKIPENDLDFVPRIASILKSKSGLGTKIMYGQAFRAPYPGETDLKVTPVFGASDLSPQKIGTFEIQAFYQKEKGNVALTYFNSHQNNLISRKTNTDPDIAGRSVYTNAGTLDSWGLELEGKYSLNKNLYITGSYSMINTLANDTLENPKLLPNHMLKLGVSYKAFNALKISVFNQYYSSPYRYSEVYGTPTKDGAANLSSYNWLTAKLALDLNNVIGFDKPRIKLTGECVNVLNEIVYNPEVVFNGFDGIQNKPGRAFYVGALFNF